MFRKEADPQRLIAKKPGLDDPHPAARQRPDRPVLAQHKPEYLSELHAISELATLPVDAAGSSTS